MRKRKNRKRPITRQAFLAIWAKIGSYNRPKWEINSLYGRIASLGFPKANAKIY